MARTQKLTLINRLSGDTHHGPITKVVTADRDIPMAYGHDIYRGQLCFVAKSYLFDGIHAVCYSGRPIICRCQLRGGGYLLLSWQHYKVDGVEVSFDDVEHIGAVVGMYSLDRSPILWAFSN